MSAKIMKKLRLSKIITTKKCDVEVKCANILIMRRNIMQLRK